MKSNTVHAQAMRASRVGVFAALYVVTSLVPISMFIGAPSFLALNLVITPVMAILLLPSEALFASLFGGIVSFYVAPMQAMFGPYTILLPVAGATFGSLTYHKGKVGALLSALFLSIAISAYLVQNYHFPYFVVPHSIALIIALLSSFRKMTPIRLKIPLYAYVSTLAEQGMMMIFAVHLLGLQWQVFIGILPLMIYERIMGTVGATLIIISILKVLPRHFSN
ncbi:MAG: hypothetical protein ACUVUF_05715 [Candidatus Bathycorpusculaceae bacterium]